MERWKILHSAKNLKLKEGTRDESCGRFGKRTPFLRGRVQLHRQKDKNQKRAHSVSSFPFITKENSSNWRSLFRLTSHIHDFC